MENPLGYQVHTIAALKNAVRESIVDGKKWRPRINERRQELLYNPGAAASYLAEHLHVFARRNTMAEWLSVERRPWLGFESPEEVASHMVRLQKWASDGGLYASRLPEEIAESLGARVQAGRIDHFRPRHRRRRR